MSFTGKHNAHSKQEMAKTWDKVLELTPQTSEYYAICRKVLGQTKADYYWKRRFTYETGRYDDLNWDKLCKDISKKCDQFLISRGIDPHIDNAYS